MDISNRGVGINYLKQYWWDASVLSKLQLSTWPSAIAYYDKVSPKFFENFGASAKTVPARKIKEELGKIASSYGTSYPHYSLFLGAVGKAASTLDFQDAKDVARKSLEDVSSALSIGSKIIFFGAVAVGLFLLYQYGSSFKKAAKVAA